MLFTVSDPLIVLIAAVFIPKEGINLYCTELKRNNINTEYSLLTYEKSFCAITYCSGVLCVFIGLLGGGSGVFI